MFERIIIMKPKLYITQTRIDESLLITKFQNEFKGKWIISDYTSKSDFKEDLSNLNIEYPITTYIYIGNIDDFSLNFQQSMLKFLEEPPQNLHIFLTKSDTYKLLTTIESRVDIIRLQDSEVISLLNPEYIEKIKKLFLPPTDAVKKLVQSSMTIEDFGDLPSIERSELLFYLWQIKFNLRTLYTNSFDKAYAKRIIDVTRTMQNLNDNCQKKIALVDLLF